MTALRVMKGAYATGAQACGRALVDLHLMSTEAPPRAQQARHWLHSLTHVHDSIAMTALDVPWWTYRAIDVVEVWLAARPTPARVFEYGAGASTFWLGRRCAWVHSVEHDAAFASMLTETLDRVENVDLSVREPRPSRTPRVGSRKEGYAGLDFASYVDAIDDVDGEFDLIVIDGRARETCLAKSVSRLAPGGLVVFDNSRRRRYRDDIDAAPLAERTLRGLTPTLPYPDQTSLLYAAH